MSVGNDTPMTINGTGFVPGQTTVTFTGSGRTLTTTADVAPSGTELTVNFPALRPLRTLSLQASSISPAEHLSTPQITADETDASRPNCRGIQ